jgi:hypothetical protein
MLIKLGDIVQTPFCTGKVIEIIRNHPSSHSHIPHFKIEVTSPKLHWKIRVQIIRMDECVEVRRDT